MSAGRYAVISIRGEPVCAVVDAGGPEEACQLVDRARGRPESGYAAYGPGSGMEHAGRPGYFVHRVPTGYPVGPCRGDPSGLMAAHPRVAIVLISVVEAP